MNDKEEEETVEASNMVEPVDLNAVEITDNIVFRKLLVSSNICSQMPILKIQFLLKGSVWYLYDFHSLSGGQGILIPQIAVGEHALIVVKKVIQWQTVQQLSGRNLALFVGVWSTMQSNAQRFVE